MMEDLAKKTGKTRKDSLLQDDFLHLVASLQKNGYSKPQIAAMCKVSESTVTRAIRKNREKAGYVIKSISFPVALYRRLLADASALDREFNAYVMELLGSVLDGDVETPGRK